MTKVYDTVGEKELRRMGEVSGLRNGCYKDLSPKPKGEEYLAIQAEEVLIVEAKTPEGMSRWNYCWRGFKYVGESVAFEKCKYLQYQETNSNNR